MRLHTTHRIDEARAHDVQLVVTLSGLLLTGGLRVKVALRTLLGGLYLFLNDYVWLLSVGSRLRNLLASRLVSTMVAKLHTSLRSSV